MKIYRYFYKSRGYPGAHTIPRKRIAELLRDCRIVLCKAEMPRQGEIEPWMASFDGFVELRKPWAQFVQPLSCVA